MNRQTAAQHAEVMRKLENINLLTDSNKLLRDERDKLAHQLREAETRVRSGLLLNVKWNEFVYVNAFSDPFKHFGMNVLSNCLFTGK